MACDRGHLTEVCPPSGAGFNKWGGRIGREQHSHIISPNVPLILESKGGHRSAQHKHTSPSLQLPGL